MSSSNMAALPTLSRSVGLSPSPILGLWAPSIYSYVHVSMSFNAHTLTVYLFGHRYYKPGCGASFWGGICLFPPWVARLVAYPSGRVAAGGSSERTDDGRVVRDFNGTNHP